MDLGIANGIYYRNEGSHLGNYFGVQNGNNLGIYNQLKQVENIVKNGLVLNLDAGNRRSFVNGNTNWYDLSGNGKTGTLNGALFNISNGGSIVFDGVDDLVSVGSLSQINSTTSLTLCYWAKKFSSTSDMVIGFLS